MAEPPPVKKRKKTVSVENIPAAELSAVDCVEKLAEAQVSASRNVGAGNGFGEAHSTGKSSTLSTTARGSVARNNKSFGRYLLPVRYTKAVGTSYAQSATLPGNILVEGRSQDKNHKVQTFSSQKMPQPFLDR